MASVTPPPHLSCHAGVKSCFCRSSISVEMLSDIFANISVKFLIFCRMIPSFERGRLIALRGVFYSKFHQLSA